MPEEEVYHLPLMERPLACVTEYGGTIRVTDNHKMITCRFCKEKIADEH